MGSARAGGGAVSVCKSAPLVLDKIPRVFVNKCVHDARVVSLFNVECSMTPWKSYICRGDCVRWRAT